MYLTPFFSFGARTVHIVTIGFAVMLWIRYMVTKLRRRRAVQPRLRDLIVRESRAREREDIKKIFQQISVVAWVVSALTLLIVFSMASDDVFAGTGLTWFFVLPVTVLCAGCFFYWVKTLGTQLFWVLIQIFFGLLSLWLLPIMVILVVDWRQVMSGSSLLSVSITVLIVWMAVGWLILRHWRSQR